MDIEDCRLQIADWARGAAGGLQTKALNVAFDFMRPKFCRPVLLSAVILLAGCARNPDTAQSQAGFAWAERILTQEERRQESAEKRSRLVAQLKKEQLSGVLINTAANFSWITAGGENPSPLFFRSDGRAFLFAGLAEGTRLLAEELQGMGFELERLDRDAGAMEGELNARLLTLVDGQLIAADRNLPGARRWDHVLAALQVPLTPTEMREYRWLGRRCAEVVEKICRSLEPGMTERGVEALFACELRIHAIQAASIRVATDERIRNFGAVPPSDGKKLDKAAMVSVCGRRWGMHVALTRIVHFGPVPEDMKEAAEAAAHLNAVCWSRTLPGALVESIAPDPNPSDRISDFSPQKAAYEKGGAIGYFVPFIMAGTVMSGQPFAWSPTVRGVRIEDTILIDGENLEIVTRTPDWPVIESRAGGHIYRSAGILVR